MSWLDAFFSWCVENDSMKSFPEIFWSYLSEVASNFQSATEMKPSIDVAMDAFDGRLDSNDVMHHQRSSFGTCFAMR